MTLPWNPETTLICDTEVGPNYWMIGFKRLSDSKIITLQKTERKELDRDRLRRIMEEHTTVGYNFLGYDHPMISEAINGASLQTLKQRNDQIIGGNIRAWHLEELLGYRLPRFDMIDLKDVQPNGQQKKPGEAAGSVFTSLKTLNGRMHGRWLQDLPFHHDQVLTEEEIEFTRRYMINDLDATEALLYKLQKPLELRVALGKKHGMDLRSKSDSQVGESIIKKNVERRLKRRVEKVETPPGTIFRYEPPPWLKFETPQLQGILERVMATDFIVKADGKVDLPKWLGETPVVIGDMAFSMGIGGLHSTESNRSIYSGPEGILVDVDVAGYYPAIIIESDLFPKALGPAFLAEFRDIRDTRISAKRRMQEIEAWVKANDEALSRAMAAELEDKKTESEGGKIQANGSFGKLGSRYSVLFAPHLLLTVTLTGQLALLMLIERATLAGIPAVSGNTDGVVFCCPTNMMGPIVKNRFTAGQIKAVVEQWEVETGFELEATRYKSLHSLSVNTYFAIKDDGKAKRKGTVANPWAENDVREQLKKNPNMTICSDAALAFIKDGIPLEQTIRGCTDIRGFVTVVNVAGGGIWGVEEHRDGQDISNATYLGKVVRYIWSKDGQPIFYKKAHATTGTHKKTPKTDGCRPLMTLPDTMPADIDYDRYVAEAREILMNLGAAYRPAEVKKIPIRGRHQALRWLRVLAVLD